MFFGWLGLGRFGRNTETRFWPHESFARILVETRSLFHSGVSIICVVIQEKKSHG